MLTFATRLNGDQHMQNKDKVTEASDLHCKMARELETMVDTCNSGEYAQPDCKKVRQAFYWANKNCRNYLMTTFESKYPGSLAKAQEESNTPGFKNKL